MPPLHTLCDNQLKAYFDNAVRHGAQSLMLEIIAELRRRGRKITKYYHRHLKWNRDAVQEALRPFIAVAESVAGNNRPAFAVGGLVRERHDGSERYWIDVYSAIECGSVKADFAIHVRHPGMSPEFILTENGSRHTYEEREIDEAFDRWETIAARTLAGQVIQFPTSRSAAGRSSISDQRNAAQR